MPAILSPIRTREDILFEDSLRPRTFEEFVGQETVKANLRIFIEAAKKRSEHLDHVLLYGPPGPTLSPRNSALPSSPPPGRSSRGPATSRPS
jgi:Holliday junction resolvasome RuvABC ATP-dependent DNA helicase subunit